MVGVYPVGLRIKSWKVRFQKDVTPPPPPTKTSMTRSTIYLKMSNSRFERWCIFQADMSVFTPAAFLAVWFRAVSRNVPKGVAALKVASAILDSRFGQSWGPGLPKTTAMPEAVDGSEIWLKPVDVDSRYPSIHRVLYTSQVVVWDFWTINSRTGI